MKKMVPVVFVFLCLALLSGCGAKEPAPAPGSAGTAAPLSSTSGDSPAPEDTPPENKELNGGSNFQPESEPRAEKISMLMLGGQLYCDTGEVSSEPRCGMMDGQISSSVGPWERPAEDGQSNFGSGYGWQYGRGEDTVEVNVDGVWHVFKLRSELRVRYCGNWFDAGDVSDETLRWLLWFNSLDEAQQLCVSFVPLDLYELCGYPSAQDISVEDAQG